MAMCSWWLLLVVAFASVVTGSMNKSSRYTTLRNIMTRKDSFDPIQVVSGIATYRLNTATRGMIRLGERSGAPTIAMKGLDEFCFDTKVSEDRFSRNVGSFRRPSAVLFGNWFRYSKLSAAPRTETLTITIEGSGTRSDVHDRDFQFTSNISLVDSATGVIAGNRKSGLVKAVKSFVYVPSKKLARYNKSRSQTNLFGYIVFGVSRINQFCAKKTKPVTQPLIPYVTGEWAFSGSVSVGRIVTTPVTFLVHSSRPNFVLPQSILETYISAIRRFGIVVDVSEGIVTIPECSDQLEEAGIDEFPPLLINIGPHASMSVEISSREFVTQADDTCSIGLETDPNLSPNEAVLGASFLRNMVILFDNLHNRISMCPRN